jgi:outer membrane murein-binding lipoprotein Lpp
MGFMAFAVVHMQKIKAGGIRGIQSHIHREHKPRTNPDIDVSRTHENYDVLCCRNFVQQIKETIKNFAPKTKTVRKDAVVLCDFIVTSDEKTMKAMPYEKQLAFFKDTVSWFSGRYGEANVINATVHMDETTPHLHLSIVPICGERLSAKSLFDRKELSALQTDFAKDIGARYGLERGVKGSERTHLSEQELKLETVKKELIELKAQLLAAREQAVKATQRAQEATKRFQDVEIALKPLQAEYEAKKAFVAACDKESNISYLYPSEAKVTKGHFGKPDTVTVPKRMWEAKWISANEKDALKREQKVLEDKIHDFKISASGSNMETLSGEVKQLQKKLEVTISDVYKWQIEARRSEKKFDNVMNKVNRTLSRIPENSAVNFVNEWKSQELQNRQNMDMEMER